MAVETVRIHNSGYRVKHGLISRITPLTKQEILLEIRLPEGESLDHEPGQFVQVSLFGVGEAPISVCSSPARRDAFELCVRQAGRVTTAIHRLKEGDMVGIRGPFGVGFPLLPLEGNDILLVAGGLGLAPLRSLITYIIDNRRDFGKVDILLGCRDPESMLFSSEIGHWQKRIDLNFCCSVDHAAPEWAGNVGVITALIPGVNLHPLKTFAIICGPPVMYRHVVEELLKKGIPERQIYLSLERRMKCGVGTCGHCQIENMYCCQDGPVFSYQQLKHLKGAI